MIQRHTNLNGLSVLSNYIHPSHPNDGKYNTEIINTSNQDQGILLLRINGVTYSHFDEISSMKLVLPIAYMSDGTRFFAREVTGTYSPSTVNWNNRPSFNTSQIEAEHVVEIFGSGIASPSANAAVFDLTNLARKWKKSGTTNRSIAIFRTGSNGTIYTPRHSSVANTEVLVIDNARQTGLASHLSFTEQDIGFAGTGFVNNFTGKMLAAFSGFSTDSQKTPISIGAFYAQERPTAGITNLQQRISMPSGWRMSFDYGVSKTTMRYRILFPDGSVQHYDEISKEQALNYQINTAKEKIFVNFFDFSYLEEEVNDLIIFDRDRNQMTLGKNGLVKKILQASGEVTNFYNNGSRITSINADGRNVTLSYYSNDNIHRVEFIEEAKSLVFEYGTYGPTRIRLQDINYLSGSTSSGGSSNTKEYIDRYEARYEYSGSVLTRMIDTKLNVAVKFEQNNSKVTKITNQIYSPETNGAYMTLFYDVTRMHTRIADFQGNVTYLYQNNYGQCIQKIDGDGNAVAMGYGKISEDGTQQMLQDASEVVFNVRNPILNHSFDETIDPIGTNTLGWKTDSTNTLKIIDGGVYGDLCLRVRSKSGTTRIYQNLKPQTGNQNLTFFAKSKDANGTAVVNVKINYSIKKSVPPGELGFVDAEDGQAYIIVDADTITKNSINVVGHEDWTRFDISGLNIPHNATSASMELSILTSHSEGEVFFDDFQMVSPHRTSYNLIQNGYFDGETSSLPTGWVPSNNYHYQDRLVESYMVEPFDKILGSKNMMLTGESNKLKTLTNKLKISGGAGEEYTLVAWAKGYSLETDIFRIKAIIECPGFENDELYFDFSKETTNWQMLLRNITTGKPYTSITIEIQHNGPNTVNFDSIQLYRDASGKHYNYDEKGNLIDQMNSDTVKSSLDYDKDNKVTKSVDPSGDTYSYTYGDSDKLTQISDAKGNKITFTYDDNGNRTKSEIDSMEGKLTFEQAFNAQNKVTSTKDELGNTSHITYDSKGRVYKETNAKGVVKTSNYDAYDNLVQLIQSKDGMSTAHTYAYNTDQSLKSITTDNGTKYDFVYDVWGKLKQVKVNNQVFASYEHKHVKNGVETDLITKQTYGTDTNESFDFTYDSKGRLYEVEFRRELIARYHYNDKGQVYQIDTDTVRKYFSYDLKGRLIKETDSSGKMIRFDYDNLDQVQKATFDINGVIRSYDFEYINEFNQYNKEGLRARISNAFGDDIVKDDYSYRGMHGMQTDLVSNAYFAHDDIVNDRVITLTKNSSKIVYNLNTVNSTRGTGKIHGGWFNKNDWKNRFYYNKSFFGWFRLTELTDERVIFSVGEHSNDYFKVLAKRVNNSFVFTLKYTKGTSNDTKGSFTIPAVDKWIFVGVALNKADSNTEIAFAVEDKYSYNFMSSIDVTYQLNKIVIGDRSQASGGSDEPNSIYQPKVHMLTVGAYKHRKASFKTLFEQGSRYLSDNSSLVPKTGVSFENPEIYEKLDTISLNGSFISKKGVKPLSYSYADKSFALDKTRLFEYSVSDEKHVYGSYDGMVGLSDTKGKLVYDFDLNTKGTMSIRFKPLITSTENRTIIMNKKDGNNLFGVILKSDNKIYMVLNGVEYLVKNETIPTDTWKTVVLTWNGSEFKVYDGTTVKMQTSTAVNMLNVETVVGADINGFEPIKHLNGQLEMLAYKDEALESNEITKFFQTNHTMSVKTYVDILGRSKKEVINTGLTRLENSYNYKSQGTNKTSLQVESIDKYDQSVVNYQYDELGNVTSMTTEDGTYEYQYDYLNRLVREYNPVNNKTLIMSYIGNNNILAKKYYESNQPLTISSTPIESHEYSYDSNWKDRLIKVTKKKNGIIVDTENIGYLNSNFIGNPTQINDKFLTWEGRRLKEIYDMENDKHYVYTYNEEGIRTSKTIDGITTRFELNGSNIIAEYVDDVLKARYHYNDRGQVIGFESNKKQYYYIRDLLGIITEVVDENGHVMVSYTYDAWGKVVEKEISNNEIYQVNHFVYKGYYLDDEIGCYYFKSRHYDSNKGRFIGSDLKAPRILSGNQFGFNDNNPIMNINNIGTKFSIISEKNLLELYTTLNYNSNWNRLLFFDYKKNHRNPNRGTPGSTGIIYHPDGSPKQERVYGPDGRPLKDYDHHPGEDVGYDHEHDWDWENKQNPRGPAKKSETQENVKKTIVVTGAVVVGYYVLKWGIAWLLAPATGGGSLVIAGVTP